MAIAPSSLDIDVSARADRALAERALVRRHRSGDADAFAAIVRLYYVELLTHARRRLGGDADAEDAVQETLLRAFRGLDRFGSADEWRLGAWLHRIVANVCVDQCLRRQAAARATDRLSGRTDLIGEDFSDLLSDPVALAAVRCAVGSLPANQRQAFLLRIVEDLPYPEVAEQLGITEDNARARVQRARATLRRVLSDADSVAGAMAMLPLLVVGSIRGVVRRALRHGVESAATSSVGSNAAPGSSVTSASAPATLPAATSASSAVSAATSASSAVSAAVNGPLATGVQLVGQLAAGPVGQAAVVASSVAAGGRGSTVLKIAAGLATAGALALPPTTASPTSSTIGPVVAPSAITAAAPSPAPTTPSGTVGSSPSPPVATPSSGSSASSSVAAPAASAPAAGATTTAPPTTTVAPILPAWVLLAAAGASTGPAEASGTGTGAEGTAATTGSSPAGGAGPAPSGIATSSSAGSSPATNGDAASAVCSGVPGFPGVAFPTSNPPVSSPILGPTLDSGPIGLGDGSGAPAFDWNGSVSAATRTPVQITTATCFAQTGSMLAVDLTAADGTEVQLVGALVAQPQIVTSDGTSGAVIGEVSDTTYLFRGTATQVAGVVLENQMPWDITGDFVAELQVAEPGNTAELTVAFLRSTTSESPGAAAASSPGPEAVTSAGSTGTTAD